MKQLLPTLAFILLMTLPGAELQSGGPISSRGLIPTTYAQNRFPLVYLTDQGALGAFSNQEAVALANFSFSEWEDLATASIAFSYSGNLDHDVTSATDGLISGPTQFDDGIFPVVFDSDGSITDARIGAGASNQVYGFATSFTPDGTEFIEGLVVINGRLTTRPDVEPVYREVITHEIGHMLGVDHSQVGVGANFSLMYPSVLTNIANIGFDPDDAAAISVLYPATNYLASVGSIEGTLTTSEGLPLSGVNVVAINVSTGDAFSTVSDYFSGPSPSYRNKPGRTGAYRINGLPPGDYYVKIESIKPIFGSGSSVASYDPPINTDIYREWYNAAEENGNILIDNGNASTAVTVSAGGVVSGIDIAANDSPTVSEFSEYNGTPGLAIPLPNQLSNATVSKLAAGYTAPQNGSLLGVRLWLAADSDLPSSGNLKVSVYTNKNESLSGIPDNPLGSVTLPLHYLSADQDNEIWLREIGGSVNFLSGAKFHVVLEVEGSGAPLLIFDDAVGTKNRSSYFLEENQSWLNFPDGLTGADGWNIRMTAIYTTVPAGVPTPLIGINPGDVVFGRQTVGEQVLREVEVRNIGTAPLVATQTVLSGAGASSFQVVSGGGAFTLTPGAIRTIMIGFTPTTTTTSQATLNIFHNAAGSPSPITLSGVGKSAAISSPATLLDFGTQTPNEAVITEFLIFRNSGGDSLRVLGLELDAPDGGISLVTSAGPDWVPPGLSYKVRIRFRPTEEKTYNGTLRVRHELDSSPLEVPITGVGDDGQIGAIGTTLAVGGTRLSFEEIRPNPLQDEGQIMLRAAGSGTLDAEILAVDLRGGILRRTTTRLELDGTTRQVALPFSAENLSAGVYTVIVRTKLGSVARRVVISR